MPASRNIGPALAANDAEILVMMPALLDRAIKNYQIFAMRVPSEEAKELQQQQAACKTALGHIDMLMRLIRDLEKTAIDRAEFCSDDAKTGDLIARAEAAFRFYRKAAP